MNEPNNTNVITGIDNVQTLAFVVCVSDYILIRYSLRVHSQITIAYVWLILSMFLPMLVIVSVWRTTPFK